MKKQKRYLCSAAILMSLLLVGCGTPLYELTKEEEALIVQSAAFYVAKHNIQQKDGISSRVDMEDILLQEEPGEDLGNLEDSTELPPEEENHPVGGSESGIVTAAQSLEELLGHGSDLKVTYAGSQVADNYVEGSAYSVDAPKGKTFYIVEFSVENITEADVELNNLSLNPSFRLVGEGWNVKSEITFLTTDFSTYKENIPAGETVKAVLLFAVSEDMAAGITEPTLEITINNATKSIKL